MTTHLHQSFTTLTASEFIVGIAAAVVGLAFLLEGLDGYLYNGSMFLEGLDHVWEMAAGLLVALCGSVAAFIVYRRR